MPINSSIIRAICFDIDGTLSETDDLYLKQILPVLKPIHLLFPKMDPQFLARRLVMASETPGNFLYYTLDRFGLDAFAGRIFSWANRTFMRSRKKIYMGVAGTRHTLESLVQRFPLAVVSARDRSGTLGFLNEFGLLPHFKTIATSQTCEFTKPFPHPILWAASQMGVDPRHCLMVGDTVVDIRAGKAAGAQTVGVLCGFGEEQELRKAGADLIVNSPVDLLTHLLQ